MNDNHTHRHRHRDEHGEMPLARKVAHLGMLVHRYYEVQAHRHGAMGDPLRGQGRVLALLAAKPETTQRELSYLLDMRQQSLSELLGKLEDKGYVTRERSTQDGRVTVVRLTEAGAQAAPSTEQMSERADALDELSEDEQKQLGTLVDKATASIEGKLEQMGIDPHQRPPRPHGPRRGPDHDDHGNSHGHGHGHGNGHGPRRGPYRPQDDHPHATHRA